MKKYLYVMVGIFVGAALLLVGYGAYMNYSSEKNIAQILSANMVTLEGAYVRYKVVHGHYTESNLHLESENATDVVSRSTGILESILVKEGERVHKGQLLARVSSEEVAMNIAQVDANLSKAITTMNSYRLSYERYSKLVDQNAISVEKYEEVRTNYLGAQDEVKSLEAQKEKYVLERDRLNIEAPMDGNVIMLYKKQGSFLNAGTPIAFVGDFTSYIFKSEWEDSRIEALLPLDQVWTLKFSKHDLRRLYSDYYKENNKGYDEVFQARISRIDPPLGVPAAMRIIYWRIDNSAGMLEPRPYQDVIFRSDNEHKGLVIPRSAVRNDGSVFIWNKQGQLEERRVILGLDTDDGIEVLSGVEEDDIVIISDIPGALPSGQVEVHIKDEI